MEAKPIMWCVYWLTGYTDRHPGCEPYSCSDMKICKRATKALECMPTMKVEELPEYLVHESALHRKTASARMKELRGVRLRELRGDHLEGR